jgi:hypothetical protein
MVARTSGTTVAAIRFSNAPELDQHADGTFPVPGAVQDPLSLVMWAYADPRDVVDAHIRALVPSLPFLPRECQLCCADHA